MHTQTQKHTQIWKKYIECYCNEEVVLYERKLVRDGKNKVHTGRKHSLLYTCQKDFYRRPDSQISKIMKLKSGQKNKHLVKNIRYTNGK